MFRACPDLGFENKVAVGQKSLIDFRYDEKPRCALVVESARDARLALASVVLITTENFNAKAQRRKDARDLTAIVELRRAANSD